MGAPTSPPAAGPRWLEPFLLGLVALGVLWFYAWIDSPVRPPFGYPDGRDEYYNLLIRGFAKGHLSLDQAVDPQVLASPNPYDPAKRSGFSLHDASLYHGKYYLYFGPAPALLLYAPYHALTGGYLSNGRAAFLFAALGFLAGGGVLVILRRRHFPALGAGTMALSLLVWGLTPMIPLLLRRSQFWEVPVAAAFACYLLALLALAVWFHFGRKVRWLFGASLAYAVAINCRPSYLLGAAILLVPLVILWRERSAAPRRRFLPALAAVLLPLAGMGLAMLAYNQARFGSPLEFGQAYQLSSAYEAKVVHFSRTYFWYNVRGFFWAPSEIGVYFPFFHEARMPAAPAGHGGAEDPHGLFTSAPFFWFVFLIPLAWTGRRLVRTFCLVLLLGFLGVASLMCFFVGVMDRYMIDFVPGLALLAVLGFWGLLMAVRGRARPLVMAASTLLAFWSIAFNAFAAIGHLDLLKDGEPDYYRRLVHAFDTPRAVIDRLTGHVYGPLEFTVRFPTDQPAVLQCLVATGTARQGDFLYITYPAPHQVLLGAERVSHGGPQTDPLPFVPGQAYRLRVEMGSFYPPEGDPYFDGMTRQAVLDRLERLSVQIDGREVLAERRPFNAPVGREGLVGPGLSAPPSFGARFTGVVDLIRTLDENARDPGREASVGAIGLTLEFPAGKTGTSEPLVATGDPGRADLLFVHYVDSQHVTFSLDHWSHAAIASPPIAVEPGRPHRLVVSFGSFYPWASRPATLSSEAWDASARRLMVVLDDRTVLDQETDFYSVPLSTVVVGVNTPGASSCGPEFTGRILRREQSLALRPARP